MSIPFQSLGTSVPEPGSMWGINLNRERWVSPEGEFSSWATIGSFNDPPGFGHMIFGTPEDVSYSIMPSENDVLRVKLRNGRDIPLRPGMQAVFTPVMHGSLPVLRVVQLGPKEEGQIEESP